MAGFGRYSLALARTRGVLATLRFDDLQIIVITSSENREHVSLVNSELDFYKQLSGKLTRFSDGPIRRS